MEQFAIAATALTVALKMSFAEAFTVSWKHMLPGAVELAAEG
jgi:hypothetical protein